MMKSPYCLRIRDINPRNWTICRAQGAPGVQLVALAIILGTGIKLWLDATTIGTNDLPSFYSMGQEISRYGTVDVYHIFPIFNQPPLVTSVLWAVYYFVAPIPHLFPFIFRLPTILADVGSAILVWKLACRYWNKTRALVALSLFALNPVLFMVSGFHGNTDPIFIFFVLLAAYAMVVQESCGASALWLGLAINIKIVPVIVVPAFYFWIPSWRKRLEFLGVISAVVLAGFGYHLLVAFSDVWRKVFLYGSIPGTWGLSRIFMPWGNPGQGLGPIWFPFIARYGMLYLIILSALIKSRQSLRSSIPDGKERGWYLLEAIGWAFLIFLIFCPGFGVQYLSWLIGPGIFLGMAGLLLYTLIASVFLFRVYTFWSGGFPWYYADSNARGQWVGVDMILDRALWILLALWAAFLVFHGIENWRKAWSKRINKEYLLQEERRDRHAL